MRTIHFKKQTLGKWRRTDGESTKHVNEDSMHREIQKLLKDGWHMESEGRFLRSVTMTKDNGRIDIIKK